MTKFLPTTTHYTLKDKIIFLLLAAGVVCFGFVLPDSLSDHDKIVHFSAHFGMSFLLASCFYALATIKLHVSKKISYSILISGTLVIGIIYKYWEIASQGILNNLSFNTLNGVLTSMYQNMSGLLAAILVIEYFFDRNLIKKQAPIFTITRQRKPTTTFIHESIFSGKKMPAASQN